MNQDVKIALDTLSNAVLQSQEYQRFEKALSSVKQDEALYQRVLACRRLQIKLRVAAIADEALQNSLAKDLQDTMMGLQYDALAGEYLMAEYALYKMLGDIYASLGQTVGLDLSFASGED